MLNGLKYLLLVGVIVAALCGCNGGNNNTGSDGNYSAGNNSDKGNVVSDIVSGTESTVSKVVSGTESMMSGSNSSKQQTKKRRVKPVVFILFFMLL